MRQDAICDTKVELGQEIPNHHIRRRYFTLQTLEARLFYRTLTLDEVFGIGLVNIPFQAGFGMATSSKVLNLALNSRCINPSDKQNGRKLKKV